MKTLKHPKNTLPSKDIIKALLIVLGLFVLGAPIHAQIKENAFTNIDIETVDGYEGNIAVCTVMIINAEHEKDADSVWGRHKKWLKETHGPWGMVSYTVAKNPEFKNPLNPASTEKTGRIIYVIHEVYKDINGINKHYSESPNGGYVEDFLKIATAEGTTVTVLQGSQITHSLLPKDCDFPVTIKKNEAGVEKFLKKNK